MEHTPGPWKASLYEAGCSYHITYGGTNNWLADVWIDEEPENAKADAHLIAAAPDMLEALERAYQKLGFWMDDDKWDDGDEAAMVQIWDAIAKAKGAN